MRFLPLILLFSFSQLYSQSWFVKRNIIWDVPVQEDSLVCFKDYIQFDNSYLSSYYDVFPEYYESLPWNDKPGFFNLSLFQVESEIIPEGVVPEEYLKTLSTEYGVESSGAFENHEFYLQYSICPFRLNSSSGKIERLTSFVLQVDSRGTRGDDTKKSLQSAEITDSPLAYGNWYKVRVSSEGIHRISFDQLKEIGLDDPSKACIYGYGGRRLPENINKGSQDDFIPVPVYMEKGSDGIFNSGDYLLFYARGIVQWNYELIDDYFHHDKNSYSDYGYYFITAGTTSSPSPAESDVITGDPDYVSNSYDHLLYYEKDEVSLIESGKEWYGELFDLSLTRSFEFDIPGLIQDEDIRLSTMLLGRSNDFSFYQVKVNNTILDTASIYYTNLSDYTAVYAYTSSEIYSFRSDAETVDVDLRYMRPDASSQGWLDYLSLNARSVLKLIEDELIFRDKGMVNSNLTRFDIDNTSASAIVWELTDYPVIKSVKAERGNQKLSFFSYGGEIKEFVVFEPDGDFPSVEYDGEGLGKIDNQNLKGQGFPDLVIVSYEEFIEEAQRLADYRSSNNQLDVVVTTPEIIYNEFSSGRPDVTAIRNYMNWLYNAAGGDSGLSPQYLLLFGDGSYIFKTDDPADGNLVPAYQSDNSLAPVSSFVSDDFFGLLDDGEEISSGRIDIGIGRLPVSTKEQAARIVDRIIDYEKPDKLGEWRNSIVFIGDDEDNNLHMNQADELAEYVGTNYPAFNVNKIYLDAYQQVSTSVGERYPDVNTAINDQVNKGALIINYTGHGGTKGLAHERVLELNDIQSWDNTDNLPLFMTATCEFSKYDDPENVSAGEEVILSEKGGGIGLFTTTRLVYAGPNHVLNEKFYEIVFEKNNDGKNYCLGDIMKYSKNEAGYGINKRNFTLLGDPAMRLTYPFHKITADSINSKLITEPLDTLKALTEVSVSGKVEDYEGEVLSGFNGTVYSTVYDKLTELSTLGNDGGAKKNFTIRNNIIYKGKAEVKDGRFRFSFIVPKDINYSFGTGKISFYSEDSVTDASGAFCDVIVGGSNDNFEEDNLGPEVEVYMNNNYFRSGGITNENPVLYVEVKDENGINTTGTGIGHDIIAVLDGDMQNSVVLNEFYQADLNSFQSGTVEYPLSGLEPGLHTIEVKVWDIYNNSATAFTDFTVLSDEELVLENLGNSPNPFTVGTYISFDHNFAGADLDIRIDIYDISGKLISTIETFEVQTGYRSEPVYWEGPGGSDNFNRQGVYIYKIHVKDQDGNEAVKSGRMMIIR